MWHYGITMCNISMVWCGVVWSTWPSRAMWHMHAPTFNKWQKKKKKTLHILTHGAMRGCALASNDKIHDIRKGNVTIRSENWTTNIRSLGFWNVGEQVIIPHIILLKQSVIPLRSSTSTTYFSNSMGSSVSVLSVLPISSLPVLSF